MSITASCGHEIDHIGNITATATYERGGERAVMYGVYCQTCLHKYKDVILNTREDEDSWLQGENKMNEYLSIELTSEQIDYVIVKELQRAYEYNSGSGSYEGGVDEDMLDGLRTVLQYYMVPSKYDDWIISVTEK